jgi:hypothetical protein
MGFDRIESAILRRLRDLMQWQARRPKEITSVFVSPGTWAPDAGKASFARGGIIRGQPNDLQLMPGPGGGLLIRSLPLSSAAAPSLHRAAVNFEEVRGSRLGLLLPVFLPFLPEEMLLRIPAVVEE